MARRRCWMEVAGGSDGRGGAATLSRAYSAESDIQGARRNPGPTRVIAVASTTAMLQNVVDMCAVKRQDPHRGGCRNGKT